MKIIKRTLYPQPDERPVEKQKLDHLVYQSNRTLFRCKNVFPFVFFPDEIIIDEIKINIVYKEFFMSEQIRGILIENIISVFIETGPFFATLKIADKTMPSDNIVISYLKKRDAILIRRLIQGLIICKEQNIDTALLKVSDVVGKAEEIGRAREK